MEWALVVFIGSYYSDNICCEQVFLTTCHARLLGGKWQPSQVETFPGDSCRIVLKSLT